MCLQQVWVLTQRLFQELSAELRKRASAGNRYVLSRRVCAGNRGVCNRAEEKGVCWEQRCVQQS